MGEETGPLIIQDWNLAYLAGMIDADGYITISRANKMNAGRCAPATYHSLRVGIAGTNRKPHDLAAAIFGGSVTAYTPINPAHKRQFQWNVSGTTAAVVLRAIQSFLLIKSEQARIGLEFQDCLIAQISSRQGQRPPYRISDEQRCERDIYFRQIISLNEPRNCGRRKNAGATLHEFPAVKEVSCPAWW